MQRVIAGQKIDYTVAMRLTFRPAIWHDLDTIIDLIVQLYHAELPGALRGPLDGQRQLIRHIVERGGIEGLRGRYVIANEQGVVLGSASIRTATDPEMPTLPAGTVKASINALGVGGTLLLFGTLLRATLLPELRIETGHAYIHSVVVGKEHRGSGIGSELMNGIEAIARERGLQHSTLRVVIGNDGARRLYERLGYKVVDRSPPWMDWITFPTELMTKPLLGR